MSSDAKSPSSSADEVLQFRRTTHWALAPMRASLESPCYNLFSAADVTVPAQGVRTVPIDLVFRFPSGFYGRLWPRAGLSRLFYVEVGPGVVEPDNRDPLSVLVFNFSAFAFHIRRGDYVARLTLERMYVPSVVEVDELGPPPPYPPPPPPPPPRSEPLDPNQTPITRWLK
ncbi:protein ORF1 [Pigeon adenovirus 1]